MSKDKVLIFIDWYVPAYKAGGPVSSMLNMVNLLHEHVEFYIVTGDRDLSDSHPFSEIEFNKWQNVGNAKVIYLDKNHQTSTFTREIVSKINPDKVYINGVFSKFFSILPVYLFHKKYNLIVAPRGMFGKGALAIKRKRKYLYLTTMKYLSFYKKVLWHANSMGELDEIKRFFVVRNHKVLPNLSSDHQLSSSMDKDKNNPIKLISICRINSIKNIEFFLEVLSGISFDCSYDIVGSCEDEVYFKNLQTKVSVLPPNITVNFVGPVVQESVVNYLNNADLFISTSFNENYGHSIVEALAFGVPVLISENNPWVNLDAYSAGYRLPLILDQFRNKLNEFNVMDNADFRKLKMGALRYYKEKISPSNFKKDYLDLLSTSNDR